MSDTTPDRPDPATAELAERARTVHCTRAERLASEMGYYAPELAAATTVGGVGTLLWHPALAAVAAAGFAARVVAARLAHARADRDRLTRQEQGLDEADFFATGHTSERHDSAEHNGAQGVAG